MICCRLAVLVDRKRLREAIDEQLVQHRRRVLVDVLLQQRAAWSRIDDGGAKLLQVSDGALGGGDAFFVGLVEQRAVHVLANDADAHAIQTRLAGEARRTATWACGRR